jgi:hypothetical protein
MIELICEICGNTFSRNIGEYNRSVKKGRKSYCSRKCTGKVVGKNLAGHRSDYDISQHSGNRNDEFTPFSALTEDKVIVWLGENMDVNQLQNNLQQQIYDKINPPILNLLPPWIQPPISSELLTPTPTITPIEEGV